MSKEFILCVPVNLDPAFPERAQYSVYTKIPCPDCGTAMWFGERSRLRAKENPEATVCCMICAITKYGLADQMERLIPLTGKDV